MLSTHGLILSYSIISSSTVEFYTMRELNVEIIQFLVCLSTFLPLCSSKLVPIMSRLTVFELGYGHELFQLSTHSKITYDFDYSKK